MFKEYQLVGQDSFTKAQSIFSNIREVQQKKVRFNKKGRLIEYLNQISRTENSAKNKDNKYFL